MHSVTVVVINFDGKHHLEECLRSVQEADGPICQVILVDDCSTDGSEKNPVTFEPDPFAEDVSGDDTPVWMCAGCRSLRADEI